MARLPRHAVLLLIVVLLRPSCTPPSTSERAGIDQEIARDILWRFHGDSRFANVRVVCEDRKVTLEGRVADPKAAADALQIALSESRGGTVESRLEIRPR